MALRDEIEGEKSYGGNEGASIRRRERYGGGRH